MSNKTSNIFTDWLGCYGYLMLQSCGNHLTSPTSNWAKWTKADVKWTPQSFLFAKKEKAGNCGFGEGVRLGCLGF
jgi:hypothetical protein